MSYSSTAFLRRSTYSCIEGPPVGTGGRRPGRMKRFRSYRPQAERKNTPGAPVGERGRRIGAGDALVVGAGHNGHVAATYLARAGRRVAVFEKRPSVGGPLGTEEIRPGWWCPSGAALDGGGAALSLGRDPTRTREEIARRSAPDAGPTDASARAWRSLRR